jgi:hypothetical protein
MAAEWDDLFAEVRRLKAVETEFKTQIASLAKTLGVEPAIGWPGLLDKIKTIKATATPEWLAEQVTAQWHDDATVALIVLILSSRPGHPMAGSTPSVFASDAI